MVREQALANITSSNLANRYVTIDCADTGTPSVLTDISGLATLALCGNNDDQNPALSSTDPYLNTIAVKIDVYPPAPVNNGCTLSTWDSVCDYILNGISTLFGQQFG